MSELRDLVVTADRELFTEHDLTILDRNFSPDYVEHSPPNASGRTQLDGSTEVDAGADTEANRALVRNLWESFLHGQDYRGVTAFTRDDGEFAQHSGDIADGVPAMVAFLEQLKTDDSTLTYDRLYRTVAEGNFVLTHSDGSIAGERHFFCELWRIEDGRVVELWDAIGPIPPDNELAHPHGAVRGVEDPA